MIGMRRMVTLTMTWRWMNRRMRRMKPVKRRMNPGARRMKITWMIMRRIKMMIDMIILVIKIQCNIKM